MKKISIVLLMCMLAMVMFGCTDNQKARGWGGEMTIQLDPGQRLVNVTWKNADLWILTRPGTEKPTRYLFKEDSNFGLMQGKIHIIER